MRMPDDDRVRQLLSDALGRVHAQLERDLGDLVAELRAAAADEREEAAREARSEAEAAAAALASEAIAAEKAASAERLAAAVGEARENARVEWEARLEALRHELTAAHDVERQADLAQADVLVRAIRALDDAGSLSEVLDRLVRSSAEVAGRAAVLLIRGDQLTGWAHEGFPPDATPARDIVLPLDSAGLISDAVRERALRSTGGPDGRRPDDVPHPFTPGSPDRVGLALPLTVDGRDVAVVYADDAAASERTVPSAWPEQVEVLARHAARCLEALTARQAFRIRAGAATHASNGRQDEEAAERYARLLISEIKLYHEPQVEEGRRMGDLLKRLRPQIERARSLYEERVPIEVRARADFFERELVRTLAGGDAARLGQAV